MQKFLPTWGKYSEDSVGESNYLVTYSNKKTQAND